MKRIFLFLLMMNLSFAGREFYTFDALQKLYEIKCRMIQIRTHLGYKLTMDDFLPLTAQERAVQYQKFDQLWAEFVNLKPLFQKQLSTYNHKIGFVMVVLVLCKDKDRYDRERRNDAAVMRIFARLTQENEELTQ